MTLDYLIVFSEDYSKRDDYSKRVVKCNKQRLLCSEKTMLSDLNTIAKFHDFRLFNYF